MYSTRTLRQVLPVHTNKAFIRANRPFERGSVIAVRPCRLRHPGCPALRDRNRQSGGCEEHGVCHQPANHARTSLESITIAYYTATSATGSHLNPSWKLTGVRVCTAPAIGRLLNHVNLNRFRMTLPFDFEFRFPFVHPIGSHGKRNPPLFPLVLVAGRPIHDAFVYRVTNL